jgi:hypothetical protein
MNNVTLHIDINFGQHTTQVGFNVPQQMMRVFFENISLSDDNLSTMMLLDDSRDGDVERIRQNRRAVAETIAKETTDFLMDQMKINDTKNGYKIT